MFVRIRTFWLSTDRALALRLHNTNASFLGTFSPDHANLLGFITRHTEIQPAVVVGPGRRWNIKIC
jgi:hypothetical protein